MSALKRDNPKIQVNSYVPSEIPNSAAQQSRQTQQKGAYQ